MNVQATKSAAVVAAPAARPDRPAASPPDLGNAQLAAEMKRLAEQEQRERDRQREIALANERERAKFD